MTVEPEPGGLRFGDYEVLRDARGVPWVLGSGSYGQTYKARNALLGTEVAIKVIRRDLTASATVRQRFLNEGRALAGLTHDHIAMLRHFGVGGDGQIYYAMDFCAGGTLAERVRRLGARPLGEALEIARQAASALAAAHAQGVIHRDLKPGNLMLAHAPPPLRVKVIDFGLAQASGGAGAGGRFHGTAQWASPEQLCEQPLDGRSDLFALGLVLWYLLDGRAPDDGGTAAIVQTRLASGGYRERIPAGMPPGVRELLAGLLEVEPGRRIGSAVELLERLAPWCRTHPCEVGAEAAEEAGEAEAPAGGELPRLRADEAADDRYARLTRLHGDLAGEWFEAELADARGSRIVFVLDEARAQGAGLRGKVLGNLARLWRRPVEGLPRFAALREDEGGGMVAEWEGACGGDLASWLKLRRKLEPADVFGFLAAVARAADEAADCGVAGVGLMAQQVRLESGGTTEGGGALRRAVPRLFPLLLDHRDLPPEEHTASDASGSTLVLVGPELACDRIYMIARLVYRVLAGREAADAVVHSPAAYVPISPLSEPGNELLREALCRRAPWDSCLALMRALAGSEGVSLSGSTGAGARGAAGATAAATGPMAAGSALDGGQGRLPQGGAAGPAPRAAEQGSAQAPPMIRPVPSPGHEPSQGVPASRVPAAGRQPPPAVRKRTLAGAWLAAGALALTAVLGVVVVRNRGPEAEQPARGELSDASDRSDVSAPVLVPATGRVMLSSTPAGAAIWHGGSPTGETTPHTFTTATPGSVSYTLKLDGCEDAGVNGTVKAGAELTLSATLKARPKGPEIALAVGKPWANSLGMRFVAGGTPGVLFCVWETRVKDFRAFVDDTGYDAVSEGPNGVAAYTLENGKHADGTSGVWKQAGGSWKDPRFPQSHQQADDHPVVCVSYLDAEAFCAWLTKRDQADLPPGWRYRLPTDGEWSAACGPAEFPWGDGWPPPRNAGNYCGREAMIGAWQGCSSELIKAGYAADGWPRTAPVGRFVANGCGLHDMGGNVWEWCATWYRASMNTREALDKYPVLKNDGGGQSYRVVRGASWYAGGRVSMRSRYRSYGNPRSRDDSIGFRCVLAGGGG